MQTFIDYLFIIYITLIENQVYTTYINFLKFFSLKYRLFKNYCIYYITQTKLKQFDWIHFGEFFEIWTHGFGGVRIKQWCDKNHMWQYGWCIRGFSDAFYRKPDNTIWTGIWRDSSWGEVRMNWKVETTGLSSNAIELISWIIGERTNLVPVLLSVT